MIKQEGTSSQKKFLLVSDTADARAAFALKVIRPRGRSTPGEGCTSGPLTTVTRNHLIYH